MLQPESEDDDEDDELQLRDDDQELLRRFLVCPAWQARDRSAVLPSSRVNWPDRGSRFSAS